jgi:hypothetical protein
LAVTSSAFGADTLSAPVRVVVPEPLPTAVACTGSARSRPEYSRILISGATAAVENRTVTVFVAAARTLAA